jgi:hypothetical protein
MIVKSVTGNYQYVTVSSHSTAPPWMDQSLPSAGQVRYNPSGMRMEVYDGNTWSYLGGDVNIDLSPNVKEVIDWAGRKMDEEQRWREMAEKNPAILDAYTKFKQAEEQLKIVEALVKEHNATAS